MNDFEHWCGNCQIRVYIERHYGKRLNYQDCPYTCEYGSKMRCSIKQTEKEIKETMNHGCSRISSTI